MATGAQVEAQMLSALGAGDAAAARALLLDPPYRSDSAQATLSFALGAVAGAGARADLKWLEKLAAGVKKSWPDTWARTWFLERIASTRALLARVLEGAAKPVPAKVLPDKPHPRWLARAAAHDFADLDALLAELTDGPATQISARAEALLGWPKDVRIARAGLRLHEGRLVRNPRHPVWAAAGNLIAVHADAALRAELQSKMVEDPALAPWHWVSQRLGGADPAPRKPAAKAAGGAPTTADGWVAWVLAAPDDLKRRALWADWLLERDDPRGELLSLQLLERPLSPKEHRRVAALGKKHVRAWMGRLNGVLDPRTAELARGFVVGGRLNPVPDGRVVLDDPHWVAIERLVVPPYRLAPKLEAAILACVPRLTSLEGLTLPMLRTVLKHPVDRLQRLATDFGFHATSVTNEDLAMLAAVKLPSLRALKLVGQAGTPVVKALTELPWFSQLERLVVDGGVLRDRLAAVEATPLRRLDVFAPHSTSWEPLETGFSYRASRPGGGRWSLEAIGIPEHRRTVPPDFFYDRYLLPTLKELPSQGFADVTLVVPRGFQPSPKVEKAVTGQIARLVRG